MRPDGTIIREWRNNIKLSQAKLSQLTGITQATLSQWELGKSNPTDTELCQLRTAIDKVAEQVEAGEVRLNKKRFVHDFKEQRENNKPPLKSAANYQELILERDRLSVRVENACFLDILKAIGSTINSVEKAACKPKGIAFFAGCGGMSLGFKAAGFDIVGYVEIDEAARRIYEANFPSTLSLGKDIKHIEDKDIELWKEKFGHIHVFIGGPPCQGFSLAGKRDPLDPRNNLYQNYLHIARIIKPDVIVFENVRLMTSMKDTTGEKFFPKFLVDFKESGYTPMFKEINAQDYGVPQSRERVVVIAIRDDLLQNKQFDFPRPTHSGQSEDMNLFPVNNKYVTFREATQDLEELEAGESSKADPLHWAIMHPEHVLEWLRATPEGKSAHENENPSLRPQSGYNTTYKRIFWDEPCSTISTNFNMISGCRNVHPKNTRSFTIREATRCQTFPDNFSFFGSWGDVRRVIGNAVPPVLARKIADSIMNCFYK